MVNEDLKGIYTLVLTGLAYVYIVFPSMHAAFNPITFWQKFVMFFTIDMLSFIVTMALSIVIVRGLIDVYNKLTE